MFVSGTHHQAPGSTESNPVLFPSARHARARYPPRTSPRKKQTRPWVEARGDKPPCAFPVEMPWRALLHPEVPSTHVHRDHPSPSTLTHATHTREVPNLRISPRRCTAFEGEFAAASVKRLTQLGAQVGKLVAQQFLRSGTITLRGRETPSAVVQKLKITEGGAWRTKLPDVRHVRGWSSLCQFTKSVSHRWIGKVMLWTHSLHSEGIFVQLHRIGTRKPLMP